MKACLDVCYGADGAVAACVLFGRWTDERDAGTLTETITHVEPYEPGAFYRRELPCLLAVLAKVVPALETIVVDGYVWLGPERRPGLGARLYETLDRTVPVVGVAKTAFAGTPAEPALRGGSARPLWVTAVGMEASEAAAHVQTMHGLHRLPALLKQVDRLCRLGAEK